MQNLSEKNLSEWDFFQLNHQPFWFWCNFGLVPLTQFPGPWKAFVDLGLGQQRGHCKFFFSSFISLFSPKLSISQLTLTCENVEYWNPHLTNKYKQIPMNYPEELNCTPQLALHYLEHTQTQNWHPRCCCTKHKQHFPLKTLKIQCLKCRFSYSLPSP